MSPSTKLRSTLAALLVAACAAPAAAQTRVVYQDVQRSPVHAEAISTMRQGRFLEQAAQMLDARFKWNERLTLAAGECGAMAPFYRPSTRTVVLCAELMSFAVDAAVRGLPRSSLQQQKEAAAGIVVFVLLHEVAHALIDIQRLPVVGREEDAADSIGLYLALTDPSRRAQDAVTGGAILFFRAVAEAPAAYTQRHFAGEHGLPQQRAANIGCLAFGRDPVQNQWAARAGGLTQERAARCSAEWARLERSVLGILSPSMR